MKAKQINIAIQYLKYIFECIGLTEVTTYSKIGLENYYLTPIKDDAKAITIVLHSPLDASNSVVKLEEYGITGDLVKEKLHPKQPGKIIVALRQVYLLHEQANTTSGIVPRESKKEVIKEQEIIEKIFTKEMLIFTSTYSPADHELQVLFTVEYYCQKAANLLKDRHVTFVDDGKDMCISLALPDALLNGLLTNEGVDQKNTRYIEEFGRHLNFILRHHLGFKVLSPQGKGMPKTGTVFLSGNTTGFQRLAFSNEIVKKNTVGKLQDYGFHYENPKSKELNVVIIDLIKTKPVTVEPTLIAQKPTVLVEVMEQGISHVKKENLISMTIPELKLVLKQNKVPTKNVTLVKANEDRLIFEDQQVFYFDTKLVAAKASEFLKKYFEGNTISYSEGKSVMVPDKIFRKIAPSERGKLIKRELSDADDGAKEAILNVENLPVTNPIEQALVVLRKAITQEVQQLHYLIEKERRDIIIPYSVIQNHRTSIEDVAIPIEVLMKYL